MQFDKTFNTGDLSPRFFYTVRYKLQFIPQSHVGHIYMLHADTKTLLSYIPDKQVEPGFLYRNHCITVQGRHVAMLTRHLYLKEAIDRYTKAGRPK